MSTHIGATKGYVAPIILLTGDPLRAEYIAKKFLRSPKRYTTVRNMLGFTGIATTPQGKSVRISVQGSGMGMPSLSIYATELFDEYGVKTIIRVGTCGALQKNLRLHDIVIASGACSDSALNKRRFRDMDFAPVANWALLHAACHAAEQLAIPARIGAVLSTDLFYNDYDPEEWKLWSNYGVLAVEMESAELYTLAARKKKHALSVLTVSDSLPTHKKLSASERETCIDDAVRIALSSFSR